MDRVILAKRYVHLSNMHELDLIAPLFAFDAAYESANVGVRRGRPAIMAMMREFFAARPDIRWEVDEYCEIEPDGVEFDFVAHEGGTRREGRERIFFDERGLIRRIEVL